MLTADTWVHFPPYDDMMYDTRCYRPAAHLSDEEVDGADFMTLKEDGTYLRKTRNRETTGRWKASERLLTLHSDDSRSMMLTFRLEGDRLFTNG